MNNVKKIQEGFDFSTVDVPVSANYLQPGFYKLGITAAEYVKPTGEKPDGTPKTPYVEITFSGEAGMMKEKFFVTPKAINRLQYLHLAWFDKKLEKLFTDEDSVGAYFSKLMTMKPIVKTIEVGGKQGTDGKIYAALSHSKFILPDDMHVIEGPFEVGSPSYVRVVKMLPANASTGTNEVMLPSSSSNVSSSNIIDDLPF